MDIAEQMQPGSGDADRLAGFTLNDLISEIKTRCNAVAVLMLVDDDDGDETVVTTYMGSRIACIGMVRDAEFKMLSEGVRECSNEDEGL